jgi:hypothetical protein
MVGALDSVGRRIPQSFVALSIADAYQATIPAMTDPAPDPATTDTGTANVQVQLTATVGKPVVVYAEATVYGVTRRDSLQFDVTPPLFAQVLYTRQVRAGSTTPVFVFLPNPTSITIRRGGVVLWNNTQLPVEDSLDVVFDDPTAASPSPPNDQIPPSGGGNIAPFPGGAQRRFSQVARQFLRVGTFPFHSVRTGVSGTITVVP